MSRSTEQLLKSARAKTDFGVDVDFIEVVISVAELNNLPIEVTRPGVIAGTYFPPNLVQTMVYPKLQVVDRLVLIAVHANDKKIVDCSNFNAIKLAGSLMEAIAHKLVR